MASKQLIVISTGRCGTHRLTGILRFALAQSDIEIRHQYHFSRISNVFGHLMYFIGSIEWLKNIFFNLQTRRNKSNLIFTDPLTSMILPKKVCLDPNTYILHIERHSSEFARSIFKLSRSRAGSFIAHNFIPFWMPGLWPLENSLSSNILQKYEHISQLKNDWFKEKYGNSKGYQHVMMSSCFEPGFLEKLVKDIFEVDITIPEALLKTKSNQSNQKT